MKKIAFLIAFFAFLINACQQNTPTSGATSEAGELRWVQDENPEWVYEGYRLYPIVAEASFVQKNEGVQKIKTLAEAMQTPGFRITERKQFGRSASPEVNTLTVQNKTQEAMLLMSGDVVTGGNQDRVIAEEHIAAAASVCNIQVYCVEKGRWHYYDPAAGESEKQVAAFKGYFGMAGPQVRNAIYRERSQDAVWEAVGRVTAANDAGSATHTYAALETANSQKARFEAFIRYFEGKFDALPNVVGLIAVKNGVVVGGELFGSPDLFRRQYRTFLHSYAADAAVAHPERDGLTAGACAERLISLAGRPDANDPNLGVCRWEGKLVHAFVK